MHSLNYAARTAFWLVAMAGIPLFAGPVNYVVNGDFETGASAGALSPLSGPPFFYTIYALGVGGATNIGVWTVSAGRNNNGSANPLSLLVAGNPPQPPAGGLYAVDFDPFWNIQTGALLSSAVGTLLELSQVIDLAAGNYVLSFNAAIEQGATPASRSVMVTLTGAASLTQTPTTITPDDVGYDLFSYGFTSAGGNVTLTFIPNDFSPEPNFMLDNVSIVAAPEPSGSFGVVAALAAMCLIARRSRG